MKVGEQPKSKLNDGNAQLRPAFVAVDSADNGGGSADHLNCMRCSNACIGMRVSSRAPASAAKTVSACCTGRRSSRQPEELLATLLLRGGPRRSRRRPTIVVAKLGRGQDRKTVNCYVDTGQAASAAAGGAAAAMKTSSQRTCEYKQCPESSRLRSQMPAEREQWQMTPESSAARPPTVVTGPTGPAVFRTRDKWSRMKMHSAPSERSGRAPKPSK